MGFGPLEVVRRIDIPERIDGLGRPRHRHSPLFAQESAHPPLTSFHEITAQGAAQGHGPERHGEMLPPVRGRHGDGGVPRGLGQAGHEVRRQERRVPGNARHMRASRARGVIQSREDAGQGPGVIRNAVGDDRSGEGPESGRIAVGIQDQAGPALRRETLHHPVEERAAGKLPQGLVTPTHAPRQAAGQDDAQDIARHYSKTMRGAARVGDAPLRLLQSLAAMSR
jgi:hypothetical protein